MEQTTFSSSHGARQYIESLGEGKYEIRQFAMGNKVAWEVVQTSRFDDEPFEQIK